MGYRNPATSAVAVDTAGGRLGQPSARMYGRQIAPNVFQGVAEWFDGVATASATLTGGGVGDSGGNVFAIKGGSALGVTAPELQLSIVNVGAGGYAPEARVKGAGLVIEGTGTRLGGLVPLVGACGAVSAATNASAQVTVTHGAGVTPAAVLVTPGGGGVIPNLVDFVVAAMTATTFTVTAIRRDNNTPFAGNPVSFDWLAVLPAP